MSNTDSITYPAVNKTPLNSFCAPTEEEFRPVHIPHFAHLYRVSQYGRVKRESSQTCLRASGRVRNGYQRVALQHNGVREEWYVHRLVAYAFLGAPAKEDYEIAHWDGDPTNNSVANLRWASRRENHHDQLRHGTQLFGENTGVAKLSEQSAIQIHLYYRSGKSVYEISRFFGVCPMQVSLILRGKSWKCLGMTTETRGHKRPPTPESIVQRAKTLLNSGLSNQAIADAIGYSKYRVAQLIA